MSKIVQRILRINKRESSRKCAVCTACCNTHKKAKFCPRSKFTCLVVLTVTEVLRNRSVFATETEFPVREALGKCSSA